MPSENHFWKERVPQFLDKVFEEQSRIAKEHLSCAEHMPNQTSHQLRLSLYSHESQRMPGSDDGSGSTSFNRGHAYLKEGSKKEVSVAVAFRVPKNQIEELGIRLQLQPNGWVTGSLLHPADDGCRVEALEVVE